MKLIWCGLKDLELGDNNNLTKRLCLILWCEGSNVNVLISASFHLCHLLLSNHIKVGRWRLVEGDAIRKLSCFSSFSLNLHWSGQSRSQAVSLRDQSEDFWLSGMFLFRLTNLLLATTYGQQKAELWFLHQGEMFRLIVFINLMKRIPTSKQLNWMWAYGDWEWPWYE